MGQEPQGFFFFVCVCVCICNSVPSLMFKHFLDKFKNEITDKLVA